jgi:transposase
MERFNKTRSRKGQKGRGLKYDISFIRHIVNEYLKGNESLPQLAVKYNVAFQNISRWVKQFSSELAQKDEIIIQPMTEQETKDLDLLKKQNESLKEKLEYEQMKNFALETMIDLAKEELGVDVRKNSGAKQPKE